MMKIILSKIQVWLIFPWSPNRQFSFNPILVKILKRQKIQVTLILAEELRKYWVSSFDFESDL